jgi:hypothetical protein
MRGPLPRLAARKSLQINGPTSNMQPVCCGRRWLDGHRWQNARGVELDGICMHAMYSIKQSD